jgi:hypothetical protein
LEQLRRNNVLKKMKSDDDNKSPAAIRPTRRKSNR